MHTAYLMPCTYAQLSLSAGVCVCVCCSNCPEQLAPPHPCLSLMTSRNFRSSLSLCDTYVFSPPSLKTTAALWGLGAAFSHFHLGKRIQHLGCEILVNQPRALLFRNCSIMTVIIYIFFFYFVCYIILVAVGKVKPEQLFFILLLVRTLILDDSAKKCQRAVMAPHLHWLFWEELTSSP